MRYHVIPRDRSAASARPNTACINSDTHAYCGLLKHRVSLYNRRSETLFFATGIIIILVEIYNVCVDEIQIKLKLFFVISSSLSTFGLYTRENYDIIMSYFYSIFSYRFINIFVGNFRIH